MDTGRETILIAEGDPIVRKTMTHFLTGKGYTVLEVSTGREALELFRKDKFDLLITDLRMPELDGLKLIREVFQEDSSVPVIICSGMGTMGDVIEALRIGAWDYLLKPIVDLEILNHSISKALEHVELLQHNQMLEREMKKRQTQEALVLRTKQEWERIVDAMPDMIAILDTEYNIVRMNKTMLDTIGNDYENLSGSKCYLRICDNAEPPGYCPCSKFLQDQKTHRVEIYEERFGGHCEILMSPYYDTDGSLVGSVHIIRDINEQKRVEHEKEKIQSQLLHAQKLESVGQLAAGIAHEINTPTQFIATNIDFLEEASQDIISFMEALHKIVKTAPQEIADAVNTAVEELDWDYLSEELPLAIAQSREGVKRVTSIVRAMKEFSHPGSREKQLLNLNTIINTTVTVARNEWKYVAEMDLDLDSALPAIPLLADEMGQVILNMLVNAAHAIAEKLGDNPEGSKGVIRISTKKVNDGVELRIHDTGKGMPEAVQLRIFDPFYTTKKVGKGTGQGLAISHDVVVEKHQGSITVESEVDRGSCFIIHLPGKRIGQEPESS